MTSDHPPSPVPRPPSRHRRAILIGAGLSAAGVAGGAVYVATQSDHPLAVAEFSDLGHAMSTLERLRQNALRTRSGWDLAHALHHVAQSIEYSLDGFPQLKPAWFQNTLGAAAFAIFSARGKMSHGLDEPVPGAANIADGQALGPAADHLREALLRFDRHAGKLAPHFAYGSLSKADYMRAHLMHLANHWDLVESG